MLAWCLLVLFSIIFKTSFDVLKMIKFKSGFQQNNFQPNAVTTIQRRSSRHQLRVSELTGCDMRWINSMQQRHGETRAVDFGQPRMCLTSLKTQLSLAEANACKNISAQWANQSVTAQHINIYRYTSKEVWNALYQQCEGKQHQPKRRPMVVKNRPGSKMFALCRYLYF